MVIRFLCLTVTGCMLLSSVAEAGSLSASPTQISLVAPQTVASLKVTGQGEGTTAGQVRVLRWLQQDGEEKLVPTRDVVASPPALRLHPGKEMTVRLVRTAKSPVVSEECYRILVDQLPGAEQDGIAVKFAIRHSIPLCFDSLRQKQGTVEWRLWRNGDALVLSGSNTGQSRVVATGVKVTGAGGAAASIGGATVLGGSTMSWPLKGKLKGFRPGSTFTLTATVNGEAVNITGKVGGG